MDSMIQAIMQATPVSKAILVLLLCMSVCSWAFMGRKWLQLKRVKRLNSAATVAFEEGETLDEALDNLRPYEGSSFIGVTRRGIKEFNRINKTGDSEKLLNSNVRRALRYGISDEMSKLAASLALLATTANTAPFIGLFGTVWGIMHSFHAIALMKSVSLATVAPGIAEALIATAVGLFVAIPATFGYNVFRANLSSIEQQNINFAGTMLNRMEHEANIHPDGIRDIFQRGA